MEIHFWGTRGSIASPGPNTVRHGGNTTCVEIRDGDEFIIVDSGTGIRQCGNHILRERGPKNDINLLITHTHWDHIQGFPFFVPAFIPGNNLRILGPHNDMAHFTKVLTDQMPYSYFPVNFAQLQAHIVHETLSNELPFTIGSIRVIPKYVNHPVPTLAYRFEKDGKAIVFMTDVEPFRDVIFNGICPSEEEREEFEDVQKMVQEQNDSLVSFLQGADLIVMDAQYTRSEYEASKMGWGHTSMEDAIVTAQRADATQLAFFHHDPERTDDQLERLIGKYSEELGHERGGSLKNLLATQEGQSLKA